MAREEDCVEHEVGTNVEAERRKIGGQMVAEEGVIEFPFRSPFKGGFVKEHVTARRVTP
jgi:hypothetical protein